MRVRVVIVSSYAPTIVSFRGALIKELVRRGCEVFVVAPESTFPVKDDLKKLGAQFIGCPLERTSINPVKDLRAILSLYKILKRLKPQIILGYFVKPIIYGIAIARVVKVPLRFALIEGLGFAFTEDEGFSIRKQLLRLMLICLYRFSLRFSTKVFFLNKDDYKEFIYRYSIVKAEKARIVGAIGVELDQWHYTPPLIGSLTFTFIGRLLKEKGILEFIEASKIIKKKFPNVRCWVIGGFDANPGAIKMSEIEKANKLGFIEWFGEVPDVRPYLAQTSVFVLPSYREGVPRSTQEAMAMGRPVITTDVPGCRETVIEGVNGFLVPPRDPQTLAYAMEKFILNPELIEKMGKESRKLAEEKFDAVRNARFFVDEMLNTVELEEHR